MRPGKLLRFTNEDAKPRFCQVREHVIQNDAYWAERHEIDAQVNPVIMFVEPLTLSKDTAAMVTVTRRLPVAMATATATATAMAMAMAKARKEYEATGKIAGGIFLSGDTMVWISRYDLEHFEQETKQL